MSTAPPALHPGEEDRNSGTLPFNPAWLANRDLLYFGLHGLPEQPFWYGDDYETAISVDAFAGLDLSSTVVFVSACHFAGGPFEEAILACKPRLLIGGGGENFTRRASLVGAHLLGFYLRRALASGLNPVNAFSLAKQALKLKTRGIPKIRREKDPRSAEDYEANRDALQFKAYLPGRTPFS